MVRTREDTNSPLIKLLKAAVAIIKARIKAIASNPSVSGKITSVITAEPIISPVEMPSRLLPRKGSRTTKKIAETRITREIINKWERVSSVYTLLYA